jgi:hypothetical protein
MAKGTVASRAAMRGNLSGWSSNLTYCGGGEAGASERSPGREFFSGGHPQVAHLRVFCKGGADGTALRFVQNGGKHELKPHVDFYAASPPIQPVA